MTSRRRVPLRIEEADPHACTHDLRRHVLGRVPFFAGLDAAALDNVDARARVKPYDAGEAIHHAGAPARHLHVVALGTVKLTRPTPDGQEVLLDVAAPGDVVGVLPALGEHTYPDSAWALTPVCVLTLDARDLDAILDTHPRVARDGLAWVAGRLRAAQDTIEELSAATAPQRVAAVLLRLADRLGVARDGMVLLEVPLGREDLAAMTGLAPESVSRILAGWRRDGIIDAGRRWVGIRDPERLAETMGSIPG